MKAATVTQLKKELRVRRKNIFHSDDSIVSNIIPSCSINFSYEIDYEKCFAYICYRDISGKKEFAEALGYMENEIDLKFAIGEKYKYSEIHESLTHKKMKPIDILRFKLSFFGATKFDPKSNLWTRITLFQGAPLPYQIIKKQKIEWFFPILENYDSSIS